jgi:VanZ family protein
LVAAVAGTSGAALRIVMKNSSASPWLEPSALLIVWLLFVLAATLFPFDSGMLPKDHTGLFGYSLDGLEDVPDVVANLLLFMPLGALLHREGQRRCWGFFLTLTLAGATGLLISLTIEYLQAFLPTRDSSLLDVLTNSAGALIGACANCVWDATMAAHVAKLRARVSPAGLARMIVGFSVLALLASGALQVRTRLSNWSLDYPLLIGNERSGDRPWRGRVMAFELTDAATTPELVREFARGRSLVLAGRRIAAFDFTGSPPYKDISGHVPELDWTQRPGEPIAHAIRLPGWAWLHTGEPASEMALRIRASNAFTLRVLCATDDANQDGPARIISNSLDPYRRNFTLGQKDEDMVFRLRTPSTGLNGDRPQLVVPGVFSSDQMREIVLTYDGATLLAAVANIDKMYSMKLNPGSSLMASYLDAQADALPFYGLGYYASLFVLPGMLLAALAQTRKQWLAISIPWVLLFTALLEGMLVIASGRSFDWNNVAVSAAVGAFVLAIVSVVVSGGASRRP